MAPSLRNQRIIGILWFLSWFILMVQDWYWFFPITPIVSVLQAVQWFHNWSLTFIAVTGWCGIYREFELLLWVVLVGTLPCLLVLTLHEVQYIEDWVFPPFFFSSHRRSLSCASTIWLNLQRSHNLPSTSYVIPAFIVCNATLSSRFPRCVSWHFPFLPRALATTWTLPGGYSRVYS